MLHIAILTASDLRQQFKAYDRDNFTNSAYEYFVDNLDGELNVIAICCEWEELDFEDLTKEYDFLADCEDIDDCLNLLEEYTLAIMTDNKILFQCF